MRRTGRLVKQLFLAALVAHQSLVSVPQLGRRDLGRREEIGEQGRHGRREHLELERRLRGCWRLGRVLTKVRRRGRGLLVHLRGRERVCFGVVRMLLRELLELRCRGGYVLVRESEGGLVDAGGREGVWLTRLEVLGVAGVAVLHGGWREEVAVGRLILDLLVLGLRREREGLLGRGRG